MEIIALINEGLAMRDQSARDWAERCEWCLTMMEKYPEDPFYQEHLSLVSGYLLNALNDIDSDNARLDAFESDYGY